jgi:diaminopropionate ammonia-lyase
VSVEPAGAACLFESVLAGRLVSVPGLHDSIMAGLNCGRPSLS